MITSRVLVAALVGALAVSPVAGSARAEAPASSPRVTILGDSVSLGWVIPERYSWPYRMADRVSGQDHSWLTIRSVGGRCLVAAGCAGTTVESEWPAAIAESPTTIILAAGENDLGKVSAATIKATIATLVSSARAAGIKVFVATIPPQEDSRWPTWWGWGPDMVDVNNWIIQTYGPEGFVFDWYTVLVNPANGWMETRYKSGDGVHPNKYAHIDMADSIAIPYF